MSDRENEDEVLREWTAEVSRALGVAELPVDVKAVLGLAGRAAHAAIRPAAPLTTFLAGYAAGRRAADGTVTPEEACHEAIVAATHVCRERTAPND